MQTSALYEYPSKQLLFLLHYRQKISSKKKKRMESTNPTLFDQGDKDGKILIAAKI